MFVERLIENNDLLDQQFLHFPFVVLLNRRVTASSGRPALSNISDKVLEEAGRGRGEGEGGEREG